MKEPKSQISYLRLSDALQITGFIKEGDLLLIKYGNEVSLDRFKQYNIEENYVEFINEDEDSGMPRLLYGVYGFQDVFVAKIECYEVIAT